METPDYDSFFRAYVDFYNAALEGKPVIQDMRCCYAEYVVAASAGKVMGGENGEEYGKVLEQGFGFYRAIGVRIMRLRRVETREVMPDHDLARVYFTADMQKKDGSQFSLDFDVAYFLQRRDSGPKVFAFVSEDEMALFRDMGLVDEQGRPAAS